MLITTDTAQSDRKVTKILVVPVVTVATWGTLKKLLIDLLISDYIKFVAKVMYQ